MDQIESEIELVYAGSRKKKLDRDVRIFYENGFVLQQLLQKCNRELFGWLMSLAHQIIDLELNMLWISCIQIQDIICMGDWDWKLVLEGL